MYRVLVPVDQQRNRAFHQAKYVERLASAGEAIEATVLYVVPPDEFEKAGDVAFSEVDAADEAAGVLDDAGVTVHRAVGDGTASEEIIRTANDQNVDEVVMGGRKRSGVTQVLLGSTVHDVMVSTDRAVTVTGQETVLGDGARQMLVPVDRNVDRALEQAAYVAGLPGAENGLEATVCYVFPHQDYAGAPPHEFEEVEAAVEAADRLEDAGVSVERVAVGGELAPTILDTAEDIGVDGIVMGGRKRSGVQKVLVGSTTLDVLLSADRPVTLTG
jgi:nucleotide-binding universal stress UspA family protein